MGALINAEVVGSGIAFYFPLRSAIFFKSGGLRRRLFDSCFGGIKRNALGNRDCANRSRLELQIVASVIWGIGVAEIKQITPRYVK